MFSESPFWQRPVRSLRSAVRRVPDLSASIRVTEKGARIRFSDGRIALFDNTEQMPQRNFLESVRQWTERRGARTITIEYT